MRAPVATATLAVVLALVGCGDDDRASDPATVPSSEADAAPGASTAETPAADPTESEPDASREQPSAGEQRFPDVVSATATRQPDGTFTVAATLSSPYDTPERYADAWRVRGADGTVFGVRELLHDHASEQPFTRSLAGVAIPDTVTEVVIEGRDQRYGWGGSAYVLELPAD